MAEQRVNNINKHIPLRSQMERRNTGNSGAPEAYLTLCAYKVNYFSWCHTQLHKCRKANNWFRCIKTEKHSSGTLQLILFINFHRIKWRSFLVNGYLNNNKTLFDITNAFLPCILLPSWSKGSLSSRNSPQLDEQDGESTPLDVTVA